MRYHGSDCCNHSALVQRFMSDSAYETVKYVAENMHLIKFIFDYLAQNNVLVCVMSTQELMGIDTQGTRTARVYDTSNPRDVMYVDYLFSEEDVPGIKPLHGTGTWVPVASAYVNANNPQLNAVPVVYVVETDIQHKIPLTGEVVGVREIYVQGVRRERVLQFNYEPDTKTVDLMNQPARRGEIVTLMVIGVPGIPQNGDMSGNYTAVTWTYNEARGGVAIGDGSELIIRIPLNYSNIVNIFHNGRRLVHENDQQCQILPQRGGIRLYKPLEAGDTFQVQLGGYFANNFAAQLLVDASVTKVNDCTGA